MLLMVKKNSLKRLLVISATAILMTQFCSISLIRALEKIEIKFTYNIDYLNDFKDREQAQKLIDKIRELIYKVLSLKAVKFKKKKIPERAFEGPLKKNDEVRIFPLPYHEESNKYFDFD